MNIPKELIDNAFHITLNANDVFAYACADSVDICTCDLKWIIPIVKKYKDDGIIAVMSYIRRCDPIAENCTKNYYKALKEIQNKKPIVYSLISDWTQEFLDRKKFDKIKSASLEEQLGTK